MAVCICTTIIIVFTKWSSFFNNWLDLAYLTNLTHPPTAPNDWEKQMNEINKARSKTNVLRDKNIV